MLKWGVCLPVFFSHASLVHFRSYYWLSDMLYNYHHFLLFISSSNIITFSPLPFSLILTTGTLSSDSLLYIIMHILLLFFTALHHTYYKFSSPATHTHTTSSNLPYTHPPHKFSPLTSPYPHPPPHTPTLEVLISCHAHHTFLHRPILFRIFTCHYDIGSAWGDHTASCSRSDPVRSWHRWTDDTDQKYPSRLLSYSCSHR